MIFGRNTVSTRRSREKNLMTEKRIYDWHQLQRYAPAIWRLQRHMATDYAKIELHRP